MNSLRENLFFIIIIFLLISAIFVSYYKYIIREDFKYFLTEDDIPNKLDLNSYKSND